MKSLAEIRREYTVDTAEEWQEEWQVEGKRMEVWFGEKMYWVWHKYNKSRVRWAWHKAQAEKNHSKDHFVADIIRG